MRHDHLVVAALMRRLGLTEVKLTDAEIRAAQHAVVEIAAHMNDWAVSVRVAFPDDGGLG